MALYCRLARPLLFRFDAEWIHERTIAWAERVGARAWTRCLLERLYAVKDDRLRTRVGGLDFPNPVGLAAGFDKNGRMIRALASLGFGFVEIGSISAGRSVGNAKPRLFRLPLDRSIVVNYGVPNDGALAVARRVADQPTPVPLGVNLVETNTGRPADPEDVIEEFVEAVRPFTRRADYVALNLNCPNTGGGRSPFDDSGNLRGLMQGYAAVPDLPPVFLKLMAHRDPERIDRVVEAVEPYPFVRGFIFNLPPGAAYDLASPPELVQSLPGTLCGPPVRAMINETIRAWYGRLPRGRFSIVGVGGIESAEHAYEKIRLGASLVQLYTALVYQGPGLAGAINRGLSRLLERDGFSSVGEAVGVDHPQ